MESEQGAETIKILPPMKRQWGWLCLPFALLALAILLVFVWATAVVGLRDFAVAGMAIGLLLVSPLWYAVYAGLLAGLNARLTLGVDGLFICRGLSRRFFRYSDIASVHHVPGRGPSENDRIRLELHAGGKPFIFGAPLEAAVRIEAQMAAAKERARAADDLEQDLVVAERDADKWLGDLRKLGSGRDYREGVVTADRLEPIMASAGCSPVARAAAAIALDGHEGSDNRRKLRIAADGYAEPKVRKRLLRIADADSDEELAAQLEALAALEKKTQRQLLQGAKEEA